MTVAGSRRPKTLKTPRELWRAGRTVSWIKSRVLVWHISVVKDKLVSIYSDIYTSRDCILKTHTYMKVKKLYNIYIFT
jgi:hypothetical protein